MLAVSSHRLAFSMLSSHRRRSSTKSHRRGFKRYNKRRPAEGQGMLSLFLSFVAVHFIGHHKNEKFRVSLLLTICLPMLLCVHNFHQERFSKEPFWLSFTTSSVPHILAFFADIVMALFYIFFTNSSFHPCLTFSPNLHSFFIFNDCEIQFSLAFVRLLKRTVSCRI